MKWAYLPKPAFLLGTRMTLLPIIDLCASAWKGHILWIVVAHGVLSIAFFSFGLMTASFRELTLKNLKLLLLFLFFFFPCIESFKDQKPNLQNFSRFRGTAAQTQLTFKTR